MDCLSFLSGVFFPNHKRRANIVENIRISIENYNFQTLFETGTIYSNFTPIVKSPVIAYRISGPDVLVILKKLTKKKIKINF